jgi:hypothetical protein
MALARGTIPIPEELVCCWKAGLFGRLVVALVAALADDGTTINVVKSIAKEVRTLPNNRICFFMFI